MGGQIKQNSLVALLVGSPFERVYDRHTPLRGKIAERKRGFFLELIPVLSRVAFDDKGGRAFRFH
jgi:hypothetical protein